MRVLITGAQGQLGRELQLALSAHELILADVPQFDLLGPDVERFIATAAPHVVVHAAAYTDVDGAEREPEKALAVNAEGTARVAAATEAAGARLLYISTDYVFDGTKRTPYLETDKPNPRGAYARSKREGERRALALCRNTLVLRTAWLYGLHGKNFVGTIMRLAGERPELRVVSDQRGCPTFAADLAEAIAKILKTTVRGIGHAAGSGDCSWHEFACEIVASMGKAVPVHPISTEEAGRPAPRPAYGVLANTVLAREGIVLPHWKEALSRYMTTALAAARH